jgi:hypothetical protein
MNVKFQFFILLDMVCAHCKSPALVLCLALKILLPKLIELVCKVVVYVPIKNSAYVILLSINMSGMQCVLLPMNV